jgi:hypothetical protein
MTPFDWLVAVLSALIAIGTAVSVSIVGRLWLRSRHAAKTAPDEVPPWVQELADTWSRKAKERENRLGPCSCDVYECRRELLAASRGKS